jgi:hypothetical protein
MEVIFLKNSLIINHSLKNKYYICTTIMKITNETIQKILNFIYKPELADDDEACITGLYILNLCKGNIQYCLNIMDRLSWQSPETLIQDDIFYEEIILIENQYIITNSNQIKFNIINNE